MPGQEVDFLIFYTDCSSYIVLVWMSSFCIIIRGLYSLLDCYIFRNNVILFSLTLSIFWESLQITFKCYTLNLSQLYYFLIFIFFESCPLDLLQDRKSDHNSEDIFKTIKTALLRSTTCFKNIYTYCYMFYISDALKYE